MGANQRLPKRLRRTRPLNSAAARWLRVSVDPSDIGIVHRGVPALPEPCCHHGCTGRRPCLSTSDVLAVPLNGSLYSACFFPRSGVTAKPIDRVMQDAASACAEEVSFHSRNAGQRQVPGVLILKTEQGAERSISPGGGYTSIISASCSYTRQIHFSICAVIPRRCNSFNPVYFARR